MPPAPLTCSPTRTVGDRSLARFETSSVTSTGSETATISDDTRRLNDRRDGWASRTASAITTADTAVAPIT